MTRLTALLDANILYPAPLRDIEALTQLLEWRDGSLVPALEEIARRPEAERVCADIEETIRLVRERLGI